MAAAAGADAASAGAVAGSGALRRLLREGCDLLLRQRTPQVRHRPPRREQARLGRLRRDEQELALAERPDRPVEGRDVGAARRRPKPFEHPRLVVLRLEPADEPRPRVRHGLVVDVDGVLGGEHEAQSKGAALLEDREDRLLRGRARARRHVAEHLVHVRERPQVGSALLSAHPGHELREDERHDELPLLLREVREVDDRAPRLPGLGEEELLRVERLALAPGGERGGGDERVERERELRPVGRREELVELEDAELAERGRLDLGDERPEVEVSSGAPRVLDEVREQHVLAARERVGLDADEPEEARHRALDLVAERFRLGVPGELRGLQRPDDVERHARGRAGGVDRDVGRVAERLEPLRPESARLEALTPDRRLLRRVLVDRDPGGVRIGVAHPRPEARGLQVGEDEREVRHVALGVEDEHGDPGEQRLLDQHDGEARLAGSGHPDHDTVRREVARADDDPVCASLAGRRVDCVAEMERAAVGHVAQSLESARARPAPSRSRVAGGDRRA